MIASINQCSKPTAWYKDHIHSEFVVIDEYELAYSVRVSFDIVGYVMKSDVTTTGILSHHRASYMSYHNDDHYMSRPWYDQWDGYDDNRHDPRGQSQHLPHDTRRRYDDYMAANFPAGQHHQSKGAMIHNSSSQIPTRSARWRHKYGKKR